MKRFLTRVVSTIFPKLVVSLAYNQLTNPQVRKLREHELETLEKAEKEDFSFKDFNIKLYRWQAGSKKVLLVHGWEGQAGNFSDIIEALLKKGFTVYAFDGPSHGFSSKGKTSLFEFTELVGELIRKFEVQDLISHSFGGVATTYALYTNKDLLVNKYALLTTPDRFIERINDVAEIVGISERVKDKLVQRLEEEIELDVMSLNVSDFVKSIAVKESIIFHDKNDKIIPIAQSKNVHKNWSASVFKEVSGTGHFRILRTDKVIAEVIEFLEDSE